MVSRNLEQVFLYCIVVHRAFPTYFSVATQRKITQPNHEHNGDLHGLASFLSGGWRWISMSAAQWQCARLLEGVAMWGARITHEAPSLHCHCTSNEALSSLSHDICVGKGFHTEFGENCYKEEIQSFNECGSYSDVKTKHKFKDLQIRKPQNL